jgi:hypothetical protein
MNQAEIDRDFLKSLNDQIRSEVNEFYLINGAFLIANSAIATLAKNGESHVVALALCLCVLWFIGLCLGNRWITHYIERARKFSNDEPMAIPKNRNIWADEVVPFSYFGVTLRGGFYALPILFAAFFVLRLVS